MADISIKKTMKRAITAGSLYSSIDGTAGKNRITCSAGNTIEMSVADTESTSNPFVVRWYVKKPEMVMGKKLIEIMMPISKSRQTSTDPEFRGYDLSRIKAMFKLTGHLEDTTWNNVADNRDYIMAIIRDGGKFDFTWQDDMFPVNCFNFRCWNEKKSGLFIIKFVMDLVWVDKDFDG